MLRKKITTLAALALVSAPAMAVISFTGTAGSGFGTSTTGAPAGSLVLFIADTSGTGNLGFLNDKSFANDLGTISDPKLDPVSNLAVGQLFGGDTILAKGAVTTGGTISGAFSFENFAATQNKNFALVWFPALTSASTEAPANTIYGIIRGVDWTLPTANGGDSFNYSATVSSYDGVAATFARVTTSEGTSANDAFSTNGAIFQIVPETSTSLLGAIGALALLRRRRN